MKKLWDEAIARNLEIAEEYDKTAVLLVKWANELDEPKTRSEVRVERSEY